MIKSFWMDTGWGCGEIVIKYEEGNLSDGKMIGGAPIFKSLIGTELWFLDNRYIVEKLGKEVVT